ncbi:MAG: prenyltransferase/squalene oxidase repeat-containing protein, partial [Planctomycetota bacterium]
MHDDHTEPTYSTLDLQPAEVGEEQRKSSRFTGVLSWITSGAMHVTVIGLTALVIMLSKEEVIELPPFVPGTPPAVQVPITKPPVRAFIDQPVDIEVDKQSADPLVTDLIEPPVELDSSEDNSKTDSVRGREDAISASELGGVSFMMTMGAGSSASGMKGRRTDGRARALRAGGGTPATEDAVKAALRWFKRHQSANGSWEADRYFQQCSEENKCEPGSFAGHAPEEVNIALTAYALLCFLGHGHDHMTADPFRPTVRKAIDYLIAVQKADGLFGNRNYEHAIATMALVDAYAMTLDPALRSPAQKGVDIILDRQIRDAHAGDKAYARLGWDYGRGETGRNDSSVTGWNLMALKEAHEAGLNVQDGLEGTKTWLERTWKCNNDGKDGRPDWQKLDIYKDESRFSYTWYTGMTSFDPERMRSQQLAPVALVGAIFLGRRTGDTMVETLANYVVNKQLPQKWPTNTYYLYYNTLGIYQVKGPRWDAWNKTVSNLLLNAQRRGDGCLDGSWDWEGTNFHGHQIGRVLSTAYCCLS